MDQANDRTTADPAPALRGEAGGKRWRQRLRFLLATLTLTILYLAIQQAWMWGVGRLGRSGWTYDDPAQTYAAQAAEIAAQSKAREAGLGPQHPRTIFQLGIQYGYLSQWLGGYGAQPEATMRLLARPVERNLEQLRAHADFLGIGPLEPLPVRTAADFGQLTQRLEDDAGAVAARIERVSSPRLRHLFMLGVHAGSQLATLDSRNDVLGLPAAGLIGKHGTLAAVPEPLWRPLTRLSAGDKAQVQADYRAACEALDQALAPGASAPAAPK